MNKERKNSIKQRATINNNNSITFVFIISFLAAALMFGLFVRSTDVLAKPTFTRGPIECDANPETNLIKCCQDETDSRGITIRWCTVCVDTVPPSHCNERFPESKGRPDSNVIAPPPSGVAPPPPSTTTCPENTALDANGNCAPVTQGPKAPPSLTDQGITTLSPSTDMNKPSVKGNANPLLPSSTSQRLFSPTGGCVPGGTTCLPCDPGLPGANCIPSGDWHPSSNVGGGASEGRGGAPPSTTTCPENTALDANGNCAPVTQGPTDQGTTTTQPPTNDNNNNPKHQKGSDISQLTPLTGNNNDNKPSKHKLPKDDGLAEPSTD